MAIFIALWWLCTFLAIDGNDIMHGGYYCFSYTTGAGGGGQKGGGVREGLGLDYLFSWEFFFSVFAGSSLWL